MGSLMLEGECCIECTVTLHFVRILLTKLTRSLQHTSFLFCTLEGNKVRLAGQDVQRGTFSHRHAVVRDQRTGEAHTFLDNVAASEGDAPHAAVDFCNSPLNEFGVLGFELGYSMESPKALVMWEAQFGDFANGAQIIFDNFLCSMEAKWKRQSGLVCLLPHGYQVSVCVHFFYRLHFGRITLTHSDSPPQTYFGVLKST